MTKEKLNALKQLDISKVEFFLINELRGIASNPYNAAYSISYVIVKSDENESVDISTFDTFVSTCNINGDTLDFLYNSLKGLWDFILRAKGMFDVDMYAAFLLFCDTADNKSDFSSTPNTLSQLVVKLLDINETDSVADYFTGRASFLRDCMCSASASSYYGVDININMIAIASMRADILQGNVKLDNENVMLMDFEDYKFDKIFANYPFSVKVSSNENSNSLQHLNKILPTSKRNVILDWLANVAVVNTLAPNGKGIAITTAGALFRGDERDIRKYFIESGYINTIIALPTGLFETTKIATMLIIFSHDNEEVRFVDARQICTKGRRYNTFSEEDIKKIESLCSEDDKLSKVISKSEIIEKDYNLDPNSYFETEISVPHGTAFETVIKNITRGAQLKASQLDELSSEEPTEYQYLMFSDIQNGQIADNLSYITSIESNLLKYCIKDKSIIISKSGSPLKVAVAEVPEKSSVLATGNLYVIELDTEKINPYFLKAFLDSDTGALSLKSICVGTVIPNIPIESLKKMVIPVPSMDIQNDIADKYLSAQNELNELRSKIKQTEFKLTTIYGANIV